MFRSWLAPHRERAPRLRVPALAVRSTATLSTRPPMPPPPTVARWATLAVALASVVFADCAHLGGSCGSDRDCKLDRVCEAGTCVWSRGGRGRQRPGRRAPAVRARAGAGDVSTGRRPPRALAVQPAGGQARDRLDG